MCQAILFYLLNVLDAVRIFVYDTGQGCYLYVGKRMDLPLY